MRRIAIFIFYSFFLVLIGRNLLFIPPVNFEMQKDVKTTDEIRGDVDNFLKTQNGSFSVYYKDLNTNESFGIRNDTVMVGASLNKLPIIGYLYSLAAKNEINLNDTIVIQQEDIQDYGTGSLRYEIPGQAYSLKYLAQLTLQQSDNTAAHVLEIRLGEDNIQFYASQIGMSSTDMVNNQTTASDIGHFYELLYKDKITNKAFTKEILGFMKDTDTEDRLPKYLPKNVSVFHKTGDAVGSVHDGGIITNGKNPFILVVMTSSISDPSEVKDAIGKIAKIIYDDRQGN